MDVAIGIDIGGTKVSGGVVDETGQILYRSRAATPDRSTSPQIVEDTIVAVVDDLLAQAGDDLTVHAVGIGAAGWVSSDRGTVLFAPHLSWRNERLRESLQDRVSAPLCVDNDANAAAWAEWRFGAARDQPDMVMITLGTGIGGAILREGAVDRGRWGLAGEFGHMQMVPDGQRCECGNRGCWEQYASGNALVREARSMIESRSPLASDLSARVAADGGPLTGPLVTTAAQEGDPTAVELLSEIGHWLGVGLANLAAALDPTMFVIGGGVSAAGDLLIGPAKDAFRRRLPGRGYRPEARIEAASLGNDAGLIGAADLAWAEVRGH
ncbi:Glucokinase [Austwickia sp. TVS 96-490-7B]|uniref:ROK family glucokinase n=1 Tax=Austwickia sp. TVS 96-490-7B TaxID=2830843 RepID=UPI001C56456B|nr:ROK family glucokinase [Austwickia sp. TVS 96-490-7B]MBW3086107.1 Glucokinase [Austwickia sp. TVS 96-490-7B]